MLPTLLKSSKKIEDATPKAVSDNSSSNRCSSESPVSSSETDLEDASNVQGVSKLSDVQADALLQELKNLLSSYEQGSFRHVEKSSSNIGVSRKMQELQFPEVVSLTQLPRQISEVVSRLEQCGIHPSDLLPCRHPLSALMLMRGKSFKHREFSNPAAETCWLSCLFQSLWHSVVFHSVFELFLDPSHFTPAPAERVLSALQKTWEEYKLGSEDSCKFADAFVRPKALADAFGEGYGDMSEALAMIQSELEGSKQAAARALADIIVLIPLFCMSDVLPLPAMAWNQAQEWQRENAPLIAVDISLLEVTRESSRRLALNCIPNSPASDEDLDELLEADMGRTHRLVSLVCYMWNIHHYVAFCTRQHSPGSCLFFNDLPALTAGFPREMAWKEVPDMCFNFCLTPRLALYESIEALEDMAHRCEYLNTVNANGSTIERDAACNMQ